MPNPTMTATEMGRKGGSSKSPRKSEASRQNAIKARQARVDKLRKGKENAK